MEKLIIHNENVFFYWKNIKVKVCELHNTYISLESDKFILTFDSLEDAKKGVASYDSNYLRPFKCLGHRVETYYDPLKNVYVYVDMNSRSYRLYSTNCEEVCEKISEEVEIAIYEYREN